MQTKDGKNWFLSLKIIQLRLWQRAHWIRLNEHKTYLGGNVVFFYVQRGTYGVKDITFYFVFKRGNNSITE